MMKVTIHAAKTNLSKLIAQVEAGEEVTICRGEQEVVRLVRAQGAESGSEKRVRPGRGALKDVELPDTFFEPWTARELGLGPDWEPK
jgi:antitoxin (DNA-binding transcriptional repressor) of toxin-antitoxin stability system